MSRQLKKKVLYVTLGVRQFRYKEIVEEVFESVEAVIDLTKEAEIIDLTKNDVEHEVIDLTTEDTVNEEKSSASSLERSSAAENLRIQIPSPRCESVSSTNFSPYVFHTPGYQPSPYYYGPSPPPVDASISPFVEPQGGHTPGYQSPSVSQYYQCDSMPSPGENVDESSSSWIEI